MEFVNKVAREAAGGEGPYEEEHGERGLASRSRPKTPVNTCKGLTLDSKETYDDGGNSCPQKMYSTSPSAPEIFIDANPWGNKFQTHT